MLNSENTHDEFPLAFHADLRLLFLDYLRVFHQLVSFLLIEFFVKLVFLQLLLFFVMIVPRQFVIYGGPVLIQILLPYLREKHIPFQLVLGLLNLEFLFFIDSGHLFGWERFLALLDLLRWFIWSICFAHWELSSLLYQGMHMIVISL